MAIMVGRCRRRCLPFYHDSTDHNDAHQSGSGDDPFDAKMPDDCPAMAYKYTKSAQPFILSAQMMFDYAVKLPAACVFRRPQKTMWLIRSVSRAIDPYLYPARGPRTERKIDIEPCVWHRPRARTPLRVIAAGNRLPWGPGAWRRKPGLSEMLKEDARRTASLKYQIAPRPKDRTDPFRLMGLVTAFQKITTARGDRD